MLRVFGAFLSIFCVLSLVVHLDQSAVLLGAAALALFGIDLILSQFARTARASRTRGSRLL